VDCHAPAATGPEPLQINTALLEWLVQLNDVVRARLPHSQPLSVADILRWPGMTGAEGHPSAESLREACLGLLQTALDELNSTRAREGEKLKQLILQRVARMGELVAEVMPDLPKLLALPESCRPATEAGVPPTTSASIRSLPCSPEDRRDEELARLQPIWKR
jgi:uncharacterized protein YicC (UPF0701 family)